jgi:hypothetical protein
MSVSVYLAGSDRNECLSVYMYIWLAAFVYDEVKVLSCFFIPKLYLNAFT